MQGRSGKDKRMDTFAREAFKLGTLRGFRHFRCELRGREELLLCIDVDNRALGGERIALKPMSMQQPLPPASPCQRERSRAPWEEEGEAAPTSDAPSTTLVSYLLAGYAHYACPHAWVRSGHELFDASFQEASSMDAPIGLNATQLWKSHAVPALAFVAELVHSTLRDSRANPFALDRAALDDLPLVDALLLSGSLAAFLRDVRLSGEPYAHAVDDDLLHCLRIHYARMPRVGERASGVQQHARCA